MTLTDNFPYDQSHSNHEAHHWLDHLLRSDSNPDAFGMSKPQVDKVARLDQDRQIAVLRACIERMPWYRDHGLKREGAICYAITCHLYSRNLPFVESDICDLLSLSRHSCGHGGDVMEPFDLALSYARSNGASSNLLGAVRTHVKNLTGVTSVRAQNIKTSSALVLLLESETDERPNQCWSEKFRIGLRQLEVSERRHWELFVLDLKPSMRSEMPGTTKKQLLKFVKGIGAALVVKRLSGWIPNPSQKSVCPIDTGGSHLLKHFIWLLEAVVCDHPNFQQHIDMLVCGLTELDWKPRDKGQKVMITAACYLANRQPDVSWNALQRVESWCRNVPKGGFTGSKLDGLIQNYQERHRCIRAES